MKAPLLFLGWGNPSRGDDGLGPLLCDRLEALRGDATRYEVLQDFQLQVEDALDIDGRAVVVFIDAAASGAAPFEFRSVAPRPDRSAGSHALSPEAVLATTCEIFGQAPPAFLLAVRGERFGLGETLSAAANDALEAAWVVLRGLAAAADPLAACERLSSARDDTPALRATPP